MTAATSNPAARARALLLPLRESLRLALRPAAVLGGEGGSGPNGSGDSERARGDAVRGSLVGGRALRGDGATPCEACPSDAARWRRGDAGADNVVFGRAEVGGRGAAAVL
jgi:hypothetical protein